MKTSIISNEKTLTLEVYSIDEAVKRRRLTKQEGIDEHDWQKGIAAPVDDKHYIYIDGTFAGIAYSKPTKEEAIAIAKDTIEWYS
jgi:hypothetical protein